MLLVAACLVGVALLLNPYYVINRKLWTDSFALLSSGVALGLFAAFYFLLDGSHGAGKVRARWWLTPALIYGSNPILGFVLYTLVLDLQGMYRLPGAHGPANWLPGPVYAQLCAWINPYNVSLLYGLLAVAVVMGLLLPFHHKKIFLKL